jgi:hypothetical protein
VPLCAFCVEDLVDQTEFEETGLTKHTQVPKGHMINSTFIFYADRSGHGLKLSDIQASQKLKTKERAEPQISPDNWLPWNYQQALSQEEAAGEAKTR